MTRQHLIQYNNTVLQNVQASLTVFKHTKDADALHRVRVGLKKAKAVARLTAIANGIHEADYITAMLKQLNHEAGNIRSLDIICGLIRKEKKSETRLLNNLNKKRKNKAAKFISKYDFFRAELRRFRRFFNGMMQRLTDTEVIHAIRLLYKKTEKDLQHRKNPQKLHRARKRIKMLIYLKDILTGKLNPRLHLKEEYLDEVQHAIGKWHDVVDSREYLYKINAANTILKKLSQRKNEKSEKLKKLIKNFNSKVTGRLSYN